MHAAPSTHKYRCGNFRLQAEPACASRASHQECPPVTHLTAASPAVRRSLRKSDAKARAFGSCLPKVRAKSLTRRATATGSNRYQRLDELRHVPMLRGYDVIDGGLVSSRPAISDQMRCAISGSLSSTGRTSTPNRQRHTGELTRCNPSSDVCQPRGLRPLSAHLRSRGKLSERKALARRCSAMRTANSL